MKILAITDPRNNPPEPPKEQERKFFLRQGSDFIDLYERGEGGVNVCICEILEKDGGLQLYIGLESVNCIQSVRVRPAQMNVIIG